MRIQKEVVLLIALSALFVVSLPLVYLLGKSHNANYPSSVPSAIPTDTPQTSIWTNYYNKNLNLSFDYPSDLVVKDLSYSGETGKAFMLGINKAISSTQFVAFVGGVSADFSQGRGGQIFDFGGYSRTASDLVYFFINEEKPVTVKPENIVKIFTNLNGVEIALIKGYTSDDEHGSNPVNPGQGNIAALVNTGHPTFPGLAFVTNSYLNENDLYRLIDTLKIIK